TSISAPSACHPTCAGRERPRAVTIDGVGPATQAAVVMPSLSGHRDGYVDGCNQSSVVGWASQLGGPALPVWIAVNGDKAIEVQPTVRESRSSGFGQLPAIPLRLN